MQTYPQKPTFSLEENEELKKTFLFEKIKTKFFTLWPWILVSVAVCVALAFLYLKMSHPEYKIHASILVQDENKNSSFGQVEILQEFGLLGKSNVDNEAEIFKSHTLMEQVVKDLRLNVGYYIHGRVKTSELYTKSPIDFQVIGDINDSTFTQDNYILRLDSRNVTNFTLTNEETTYKGRFGDTLSLKEGKVIVAPGAGFAKWAADDPVMVSVFPVDGVAQYYMNALTVSIPNKQVSIIYLALNEATPSKGEDVLNALITAYMKANVNDKNRIADSTIKFIDDRLRIVSGELSGIEKDIEHFKTDNRLTDLTTQAGLLLQNTSEYAKEQTTAEVQLSVVESLEQFLKNNIDDKRVIPSSLVMQDVSFLALLERYNETQLQRDKMLMSLTENHPSVVTVTEQLRNLRAELLSSIGSVKRGIEIGVAELRKKTSGFAGEISKVPAKERAFLDYSRQQAIKQELYLFLLKKREETTISKSSTIANARIIDKAKSESSPFKPQKKVIMAAGIFLGLILPFLLSFGRDALNNKIVSPLDITGNTRVPLLAEINHYKDKDAIAVALGSRQIVAEQFRSLRTNLQYLLPSANEKVILVTSSMSGEGKSFLSINLCAALALAGKKVILLELDLRKPKITENLRLNKTGFSNYIISGDDNWASWIQHADTRESFDVLASGPLPPNPAELLMLPKTAALFESLKKQYDYIVIDSPPIGMVTDAEILASYANATLYVVRHRYTFKQQVQIIEKLYTKNTIPRLNIVINDVDVKKGGYGYYGYGYGGYTYGEEPKKKKKKK